MTWHNAAPRLVVPRFKIEPIFRFTIIFGVDCIPRLRGSAAPQIEGNELRGYHLKIDISKLGQRPSATKPSVRPIKLLVDFVTHLLVSYFIRFENVSR